MQLTKNKMLPLKTIPHSLLSIPRFSKCSPRCGMR